jgi:hypothetical protein
MRTVSDSPTLIPERVAASCHLLSDRVHARFPDRGLDHHAQWFAQYVDRLVVAGPETVAAPLLFRLVSWLGGLAVGVLLFSPLFFVRRLDGLDHLPVFLSSLDALSTVLAASIAAFFTMRSIEHAYVRRRAVAGLGTLRSFAHVTDMLQITKCPTHLLFPQGVGGEADRTAADARDEATALTHYLTYCSELYALTSKVAVLYGEWTTDALVLDAIDDVDDLCMGLESKTTQKILLLEQLNQRVQSP